MLSRCLQFNLKHLSSEQINGHLQRVLAADDIDAEPEAIDEVARAAQGSVRDALSVLDQAIAYGGGSLRADDVRSMLGTLERGGVAHLIEAACGGDAEGLLAAVEEFSQYSPNYQRVLQDIGEVMHRVAMAQRVPEAIDRNRPWSDLVRSLAEELAPEEVQLNYDIVVRGLRDLPYAPTARAGLEMTLLRMLAFRPADDAATVLPKRSKQPAAESEHSGQQAEPSAPSPSASAEPAPALSPDGWSDRVGQLALSGPARELATNCELVRDDGDRILLRLDPRCQHFRTASAEKKLREGLSMNLGREVAVAIEERDGGSATPAAKREQEVRDRKQRAEDVIARDPNVAALQETMGARILPSTTRPTDGETR